MANASDQNRALFLDRDGVINKEKDYLHRIEEVDFVDGIFELCRFFQARHFRIIVITNQAGIGRGYYTEDDFQTLMRWMSAEFRERDITIDRVYHCPYHPEAGVGHYRKDSPDRKPKPGMILKAQREFNLALDRSILIGDHETDIMAGKNAGVATNVLLADGAVPRPNTVADFVVPSLKSLPGILSGL